MLRSRLQYIMMSAVALVLLASGCSKVEYKKIDSPAYLRVFNNLNYTVTLANKDEPVPFLTMLIDPQLDQDGMPVNAAVKGDFLDQREPYAPPYPSHAGTSVSYKNPEYPGKENVLVGPVLNGFDLSSWAQIPSGKHRVVFLFRPVNSTPFFDLESKLKKNVLIDTTITLDAKEVYTLHVLQKDFTTKKNGIYLRQETFQKLPLSDSMVYTNFYNLSAKGFQEADASFKTGYAKSGALKYGVRDNMNIFYTLYKSEPNDNVSIPGYFQKFLGTLNRNAEVPTVTPYYSFPLFADGTSDGIHTTVWQHIDFMAPGMSPSNNTYYQFQLNTDSNWIPVECLMAGKTYLNTRQNSAYLNNMIVNIPSGTYSLRSFATVNSIEIVNGNVYLTTVQRKYAPPIY